MSREQHDGEIRPIPTDRFEKKINQPIDVLNEMKNELQEEKRKYIISQKDHLISQEFNKKIS